MIKPAIYLKLFDEEILVLVKLNKLKVLNSACVKLTADINTSQK